MDVSARREAKGLGGGQWLLHLSVKVNADNVQQKRDECVCATKWGKVRWSRQLYSEECGNIVIHSWVQALGTFRGRYY